MNRIEAIQTDACRRTFLLQGAAGVGAIALSSIMPRGAAAADRPDVTVPHWNGVVQPLHSKPRVRRVIHLYMAGGPSHLETLDHKPKLAAMNGQPMPESFTKGRQIAQLQGRELRCLGPQHAFRPHGESGQMLSDVFPHISTVADEICIINSMQTDQINHDPAHTVMNTGTSIPGRPSMGSWVLYGLGSESDELPGYVVLTSVGGGQSQPIAARQWHSGFLPGKFQGVEFRSKGDPVLYVKSPNGVGLDNQREVISAVQQINQIGNQKFEDTEIETRISQYELAFRMQSSVPKLMDVSGEPEHILQLYGTKGGDGSFASNCLLARRLAERGVRFIQLYHRGWDHHGGVAKGAKITAGLVDQGTTALIRDLKQRGMLEETLIIWGGEFGRTPMAQGSGRDHHIMGFSMFLAGGGIKGGITHGATDELGYEAVRDTVHVNDLHATLLHLLGIDHEQLTYRFQGRDFRLTDVSGHVLHDVLT